MLQFTSLIIGLVCTLPYFPCLGYRDGAREESCYNHSVVHERAIVTDCSENCRFFLIVKEVVNETTLELGNETTSYECGKLYGVEVANDLNAPEGYLVQARYGNETTSEIVGEFLNRSTVQQRNSNIPLNFKILQCRQCSECDGERRNNSATHPDTVNMAGTLQLFWQAPDCSMCGLRNVTLWFTIVQQLTVVYNPSKTTVLQLQNYDEPLHCSNTRTTFLSTGFTPTTSSTASFSVTTGVYQLGSCLGAMLLLLKQFL